MVKLQSFIYRSRLYIYIYIYIYIYKGHCHHIIFGSEMSKLSIRVVEVGK